ncbi:uncharacterized protein LOC119732054 isoform X2 [Patiria miniata]|uniref:Ubiquitin-like domain-containing protein n=1 Tax=Patiria miniata TaxID=46514 RepID=A0A914ABR5_PATMI|nr:uncharacterized protein LOC119732054 isoform X2 [Patiria miniata]
MGDFWLQPLRSLSDLEDAKRAARHINDHSLAKMVTRKKKVRKSKKEAFQSVLLAPRFCQESIPPKSVVSSISTENQECSSKPCQKRQIQLFVNSSLTSPVCLQLHPSTAISALKGLLQDKVGIEPEKQHLFTRKNHELRDDLSLGNYGIEQDTNIELRLVSGLMGGADEQKTKGRKKTKRRQKKSTSTDKMSRQDNSNEEEQVRSPDESGHSPTSSTIEANASNQSTGRKKRRRRRRQNHVEKAQSCEEATISTSLDQDDQGDSQTCSSTAEFAVDSATNFTKLNLFLWILCLPLITIHVILSIWSPRMIQVTSSSKDGTNGRTSSGAEEQERSDDSGHSSTSAAKPGRKRTRRRRHGKARQNLLLDEAERQPTSDDKKQDHSDDLGKSYTSAGKPGKIRSRGKTKKKSGKIRKGKTVATKSPSEEEAIDETSKGDQAEDKFVNSRDSTVSSSAKTTAKRNNQSKGRKRTRRRRYGKARQKPLLDEAERQSTSDDVKRDPLEALGDSFTSAGKPGKIQSKCKTKKRSGKTSKGQKLAKKSPSEEEAIGKTSKGDQAENKLVNSRDSTVSSSAKTTAKRNNQPKGRKKTKKQTNADKKPSCEEKKESQIQLFVISSLRSPVCLQLHPSTTISALKGLLQDKMGIEPKKQRLYTRKNHELKGRMSLKELGIQQDTNIELRLVSGLMGGADDEQKSAGNSRERTSEDSRRRQKGKRKASRASCGGEDTCNNSSAVKPSAGHPSGETKQKLEQPRQYAPRRILKGKRRATKRRTSLGGEGNVDNSEDFSISIAVKATAGHPSVDTKKQKLEHPRKDDDSSRIQSGKSKAKTGTSLGGEKYLDNSEESFICSAVNAPTDNLSGEIQVHKVKQPRKDNNSGRRRKRKRKAANRSSSVGGEQSAGNSEDSSTSTAIKARAGQPSEGTREQIMEQPRKDNDSRRMQKGKSKAKAGTSVGGEGNSEESLMSSAVKAPTGLPSGKTQKRKINQLRNDNDSGRIQKRKRKANEARTNHGYEENAENLENSSTSSAIKAPADHLSRETKKQKLEQTSKDTNYGRRRKRKRKASNKSPSGAETKENMDNSEDSSKSSAVKAPPGHLSGETQEQKVEQPRKAKNSGRRRKRKRKAANKSPSGAETNKESLSDTEQQILRDPGDSCSSPTIGSAASTSPETVAGTIRKRERHEMAGSEAEESKKKTVASDRQQVAIDTGSSLVSTSVTASSVSRSRRRRRRRRRKNSEKKAIEVGGDSKVIDLERHQPKYWNVTGASDLNLQQDKGRTLELQRPKDQETEEIYNRQYTSSKTPGVRREDFGPDRLKADRHYEMSQKEHQRQGQDHVGELDIHQT